VFVLGTKNIYLVGMMGSGKTVTGRALAKLMNRAFIDLDDVIVQSAGKSISRIFEQDGENRFRAFETGELIKASHSQAVVIGCG
jgi:shikimate kinase